MKYLVIGSDGPGFTDPGEAIEVLDKGILPTFAALMKLEEEGRIVAGGLPVGDRAFVFVAEAASHDELDGWLRDLPAWGALQWDVTPLQSFESRASKEHKTIEKLRQGLL